MIRPVQLVFLPNFQSALYNHLNFVAALNATVANGEEHARKGVLRVPPTKGKDDCC